MFISQRKRNQELWEFCKMEYKNDPEFAYAKYTEEKNSLLERIKKYFNSLINKELRLEIFSLRKAPF